MQINIMQKIFYISLFFSILTFAVEIGNINLNQFDQFDQFEKHDKKIFNSLLRKAEECINSWNFECAERALAKAKKFILSKRDNQRINALYAKLKEEEKQKEMQEEQERQSQEKIEIVNIEIYHNDKSSDVCVEYQINGKFYTNDCHLIYYVNRYGSYEFIGHYCTDCIYNPYANKLWCVKGGILGYPSSLKKALLLVIKKCVLR